MKAIITIEYDGSVIAEKEIDVIEKDGFLELDNYDVDDFLVSASEVKKEIDEL